jgi:hypothetical protein
LKRLKKKKIFETTEQQTENFEINKKKKVHFLVEGYSIEAIPLLGTNTVPAQIFPKNEN